MDDFFSKQSNRTYILFSIAILFLVETIFICAWSGVGGKFLLTIGIWIAFISAGINTYYLVINLLNDNTKLSGGFVGGITIVLVIFALLFSAAFLYLQLDSNSRASDSVI
jgi:hypothetical protein